MKLEKLMPYASTSKQSNCANAKILKNSIRKHAQGTGKSFEHILPNFQNQFFPETYSEENISSEMSGGLWSHCRIPLHSYVTIWQERSRLRGMNRLINISIKIV